MGCEWNVPLPAERRNEEEDEGEEEEEEDCPTVQDKVTIAACSAKCARQSSIQRTSKASEARSSEQTLKRPELGPRLSFFHSSQQLISIHDALTHFVWAVPVACMHACLRRVLKTQAVFLMLIEKKGSTWVGLP